MVIFNGGPDAGSSVAHKHLQVFLRPGWGSVADGIVGGGCEGMFVCCVGVKGGLLIDWCS